ncbi:TonB-dependent receptor [Rapidithrix thailandica]|uniref:TonB-dependent receptor n=1 Tax=Rapidithrix thailandica TaxID=413964 RepID=A0AAW9RZH0_9BACT
MKYLKYPNYFRCTLQRLVLLCMLCMGPVLQNTFAQADILSKKVTLQVQTLSLQQALEALEQHTGCTFSYAPDMIDSSRKVKLDYRNTPLGTVLSDLLGEQANHIRVRGKQIHIQAIKGGEKGILKGQVHTADGQPAPYVSVWIEGTGYGTSTDENGYFKFQAPAGTHTLLVSSIGLGKQEQAVVVRSRQTTSVPLITLHESAQELKEVIVEDSRWKDNYKESKPSNSLRLKTPLLETPQNIQVMNSQLLASQHIFNPSEGIERNVSGVRRVLHQETYASIYIRGFSTGSGSMRNGMSVGNYFGPLKEDMSFVDRVEFVKGPAGFMMGNTQPGGFYNVVTKKPTGRKKASVNLTTGSFSTFRAEADIDNQLDKQGKFLYRLNLMGQMNGSHTDYRYTNGYAIDPSFKYIIDDKTSLTVEYLFQHMAFSGFGPYLHSKKGFKDLPRHMTFNDPSVEPTKVNDQSVFINLQHQLNKDWEVTAQLAYLDYKMRGQSLYPSYNSLDEEGNMARNFSINDVDNISKLGQIFVNGSVQTGGVSHKILAGLDIAEKTYYADWSKVPSDTTLMFNMYDPVYGINPAYIPKVDRSKSLRTRGGTKGSDAYYALYIQDQLAFWDNRVRLTLGGRFTSTKKPGDKGIFETNEVFTPRAGLSISVDKNLSLYTLYDQTFSEQLGQNDDGEYFDPTRGTNIEAGIKKDWWGGSWNTTLSVYRITKTNVLTTGPSAVEGAPPITTATGEVQSQGVELDIKGEILPNLSIVFNYAYTDAEVTKDRDEKKVGQEFAGIAKHITNTWATYRIDQGSLEGLGFSLGYQFQTDRTAWPGGGLKLPDNYFSLDAGVSWTKEKYSVSLLVNNLTDRYNYTGFFPGAWGYTHYGWQALPPRNFRLRVGYTF